jgi:DNA-binding transcriptional LysR family regulator
MDTDLLRTFVEVVRTRSFTAAARELGYVQSTVTGHVQSLERRVGARLIDRLPTGAIATEAGRRLVPYAQQMLDLQLRMLADVPTEPGRPAGIVRLVAPESLVTYRLPALVTRLRTDQPDVRLALVPGGTAAAAEAVRRGTADVALVLEPVFAAADLVVDDVGGEEPVLLAAPGRFPAAQSTWADLAERDALLLEDGCSSSDHAARELAAAGQPAARRTHFGSIEAVKQCAAAGLGWTVLPAVTAAADVRVGALVVVGGPVQPRCVVHVVTHRDRTLGAAARVVVDAARGIWAG